MDEFNPQLHQKILERYLKLVEKNHRANDYALDRNRQLDLVKQEQKRLSELLKVERTNVRERIEELEQLSELIQQERKSRKKLEANHSQSIDYITELEKAKESLVLELDARINDLRKLQENFDGHATELKNLSEYVGILESQAKEQSSELNKL